MTTSNPFLTNDVYTACQQARVYYLDTAYRKQQFGGTPIDRLEASKQRHRANLDMYREEALRAAEAGDISSASTQLAYIAMEWGLYKANDDLIDATNNGTYLDPADPDVVNDFDLAIEHKVVFWAMELTNKWGEGDRQRKNDLGNLHMQRQAELFTGYQQVIQSQGSALSQAHRNNQQYADIAFRGVQQAQQGVQWMQQGVERMNQQAVQHVQWMQQGVERINQQASQNVYWAQQGVQGMYAHGVNVMNAALQHQQQFNENMVQNLPREMEKAQAKIERRRIITRGIIALVLVAAVPLAIGLAWFLLKLSLGF